VPRSVSDDEFATSGGEIPVSHVDGDALLAFGAQTIVSSEKSSGPVERLMRLFFMEAS